MSDPGLDEAIRAVGGVTELARRIGISQPSVSNWSRVPAERVLSVEAASGVARAILRPDLYAEHLDRPDEVDAARAREYGLRAILCEIMAGLIRGQFAAAVERQQQIFEKHLVPWIGRFFADLAAAKAADFYRHVGAIGNLFMEIETQAFALPE